MKLEAGLRNPTNNMGNMDMSRSQKLCEHEKSLIEKMRRRGLEMTEVAINAILERQHCLACVGLQMLGGGGENCDMEELVWDAES